MNKTTYANFHGVVNVFLGGDCVKNAFNVFGMPSKPLILFFHNYAASNDLQL